ncbi:LacI family DNA-binding transcriptional regulator [Brachybacterium sp. FME24]|uniref:LacI family DNA-binding transcriptional regulator n=1 Tax=Brachybacterium sp. FME24 TaxID=2742605 RepID=UPI0018685240|nr:LacI family DNA-binding transcriptional regulator [Brachybacterium sp. FME24]
MTTSAPASPEPRSSGRVRLEDVAAAAGVSRTSASRVMLGQGKVSEETRRRVHAVAEELGYVTNVAASELASGGSSTVGLLLRDASNPAYGLLFTELQKAAHAAGVTLLSMTIKDDDQGRQQIASLHRLMGMRVAGLIVATGGVTSEQLEPFRSRLPIIRAGRPESSGRIHAVSYDEADAARHLAEHLLNLGHNAVAVQTARAVDSYPEFVRSSVMAEVLEERGATVHRLEYGPAGDAMKESVDLVRSGRVTAVMAPSDLRQLNLIRHLQAAGLRTPEDVATTGCDGILPGVDLLGLTTMRIAVENVAERTIANIARMIGVAGTGHDARGNGETAERGPEGPGPEDPAGGRVVHERLPGRFIQGRTAGPPRTTGRKPT